MEISYLGDVTSSAFPVPPQNDPLLYDVQWRNTVFEGALGVLSIFPGQSAPLSQVVAPNESHVTENGYYNVVIRPQIMRYPKLGYASLTQNLSGGYIKVRMVWLPDVPNTPSPSRVFLDIRRSASISGIVQLDGPTQTATLNGTVFCGDKFGSLPNTDVTGGGYQIFGPFASQDTTPYLVEVPTPSGTGEYLLSIYWVMTLNVDRKSSGQGQPPTAWAELAAILGAEISVTNAVPARFGGAGTGMDGNRTAQASDPSFTRWLPLSFSPLLSSQPFRTHSGALPPPWGNINCFYSMRLHRENDLNPNLDLNGFMLLYKPNPNSPPPYLTLPGPFIPQKVITDADGSRLVFNSLGVAYEDAYSDFVTAESKLQNAGPPGALKQRGHYTYSFEPATAPGQVGRLTYITDGINTQSLTWQGGTGPDVPYLIVTDSSSGRQIGFYRGIDGYINKVVDGALFTRTELGWDGSGHLTSINVYPGIGSVALHTDTFTYNGDAIQQVNQGLHVSTATFQFDSLLKDPFANSTPRVSSMTLGATGTTGDNSPSSDDASKPVAGIWQYNWGHLLGYSRWGADIYKQSVTDPNNQVWTTELLLSQGTWGSITGTKTVGPNLTGAAGANRTEVTYYPSYANPQTTTIYDPLYFANPSLRLPWIITQNIQGNVTSVKDYADREWTWSYDASGKNLLTATDSLDTTWTFGWGEDGNHASRLTSITDPDSLKRVQIDYKTLSDPFVTFGQPNKITVPANASASNQEEITYLNYGPNLGGTGDLLSITDPLGDILSIGNYDALGDPGSVSVYPTTGQPTNVASQKLTASIVWDAAQRAQLATFPNGVRLVPTYNNGVLTQMQVQSPASQALSQLNLSYDTRERVYEATDIVGVLARFRYDQRGYLTRIYDGRSDGTLNSPYKTIFDYGPNGEVTRATWPGGANVLCEYDEGGRLKWLHDERGYDFDFFYNVYQYDSLTKADQVRVRLRANSAYGTPEEEVISLYDPEGRLEYVTDKRNGVITGTRDYVYTGLLKRLTSIVTTIPALPAGSNTFTVSYTYKPDGSVAQMTSPVGTTTYSYDKAGQVKSLTDPLNDITTWDYDHAGRLKWENTQTYQSKQIKSEYIWGVSGQGADTSQAPAYLRQIKESIQGVRYWDHTFTRSYLGKIIGISGIGSTASKTQSSTFTYDSRGRLTGESQSINLTGQSTASLSDTYTFDVANNLNANGNGWTYDVNGRLTSTTARPGLPGATGLSYDASGQLAAFNNQTLTYDGWGNLKSLTGPNGTITYDYDGAGRLLSRTTNGVTTYFLYEGGRLLAELNDLGQVLRFYVWGINGLISQHDYRFSPNGNGLVASSSSIGPSTNWNSRYHLYDGQGNTRALVNSSGSVVGQASYGAFGAPLQQTGTATSFGYGGQQGAYTEGNTGLILSIHQRPSNYVPGTGQFAQPASIGYSSGPPHQIAGNDPVNVGIEEAPDAHIDEVINAVQGRMRGVNHLAAGMETALNIAASFNPLISVPSGLIGRDASGKTIGWGERALNMMDMLPAAGHVIGAVVEGGRAVRSGARLARRAEETVAAAAEVAEVAQETSQSRRVRRIITDMPDNMYGPPSHYEARPKFARGQVEKVWNDAMQDGRVFDPNTGEELFWDTSRSRRGQWDMGHKTGHEYDKLYREYMGRRITNSEFLRQYRNPERYQPQAINPNRGHRYQAP